jgi:hypothetical protein
MISLILLHFLKSTRDVSLLKHTVCQLLLFIVFLNSLPAAAANQLTNVTCHWKTVAAEIRYDLNHVTQCYFGEMLADA